MFVKKLFDGEISSGFEAGLRHRLIIPPEPHLFLLLLSVSRHQRF